MPRRKTVNLRREIGVDSRFRSSVVQRLINMIMGRGKKSVARGIVYGALDIMAHKLGGDELAYVAFEKAIGQVRPSVEVKSRRVGGGIYQIPMEVRPSRALALSLRWIIQSAKARNDKTMKERLAKELLEAADGHGNAMKKKSDVHRMAEANRAFSHYAW